ncbi:uncharacterized protein LOC131697998 [Acipenser ruthenus]|uniref:uncharacterized protein LOC131697998 n=1 Tax=Acipenser ruthenus TaxID=7906 RepID=UPI0027414186|nr:uncharacterized protein LOC131697998 [Acipenser ruthenus]
MDNSIWGNSDTAQMKWMMGWRTSSVALRSEDGALHVASTGTRWYATPSKKKRRSCRPRKGVQQPLGGSTSVHSPRGVSPVSPTQVTHVCPAVSTTRGRLPAVPAFTAEEDSLLFPPPPAEEEPAISNSTTRGSTCSSHRKRETTCSSRLHHQSLEEYVYLQVVRFTIETLEVADEISVGYRIITYCQPSQKCVDQEVKAASQRHEDGSEPILAVVSSEYVTFKHIWYFYSLPLVIMSHGHPNTDYEDYWQNNELGALEAVLSLLARATWNLVVSVEISEQRNLDLKNVAQELVQRNGQEICIELNYQGCFCVGKYSQLAKEMINYRQVYFDLGL